VSTRQEQAVERRLEAADPHAHADAHQVGHEQAGSERLGLPVRRRHWRALHGLRQQPADVTPCEAERERPAQAFGIDDDGGLGIEQIAGS